MTAGIAYAVEPGLGISEFRRVLVASGLAERRPRDEERLARMLAAADLIVTARALTPERAIVGVARVLTDFAYCAYVSELAVDRGQQRRGIGQGLLERVRGEVGPECSVLLTAALGAESFYERIGMPRVAAAFRYDRTR